MSFLRSWAALPRKQRLAIGLAGIGISLLGIYVDAKIADVDGTKAQKIKEAEERKDEQRRQKMDKA